MNAAYLTSIWSATSAIGQHLWQSTLFACVAGGLTLALRKNHARARYWLWMAASVKFLIPFSWLVAVGNSFAWMHQSGARTGGFYQVIEEVGQPLMRPSVLVNGGVSPSMVSERLMPLLPTILAGVWLCGFAAVLFSWSVRWRRISANIRDAAPMGEGREVDALRRLEQLAAMPHQVEMRRSGATLEPGIFGWARPILLWPEGISDRLDDAHVEAIIAHELWHVRRKDNLAAMLHMIVEAVFWFHPLVWWVGARLIEERERACDEEVLALGSERHVYAESILKVCEFCVASPLPCVSGVTGADLKKRMVHIMSEHVVRKLDFSRRLLLSAAALLAIAVPIAFGLFNATPSRAQSQESGANAAVSFESVTIKPGEIPTLGGGPRMVRDVRMMVGPAGFRADNVSLRALIQEAYGVQADQIDGPSDLLDTTYTIDGKTGRPTYEIDGKTGHAPDSTENFDQAVKQNHLMLQNLLAESFKLVLHHESKVLPSYALVVAENGPKLQPSHSGGQTVDLMGPSDKKMSVRRKTAFVDSDQMMGLGAQGISTSDLSAQLSRQLGNAVMDKTGLTGSYDLNLQWTADAKNGAAASGTSLFKALQEQLGLKLEPQESPMDYLVIDHVEKLAEN